MAILNNTHIAVIWDSPASPNGIVSYSVTIEERDLLTDDTVIVFLQTVTQLELFVEYEIAAYSNYTISVTSQTSAGIGDTQIVIVQTPEEGE